MIVQEIFNRIIESRINKLKISEERKGREIERIREWSQKSDIFSPIEEDEEWEFEGIIIEDVDLEREKRVDGWREYYEGETLVFSSSEEERGEFGRTELMSAIVRGEKIEEIRRLIEETEDYGLVDNFGYDIVQLACLEYRDDILEEFKDRGIYQEE